MNIELFNFHGNEVRVIADDANNPRWVASDVAKVLGYRDAANMCRRLDDDEKDSTKVSSSQVNSENDTRRMTVITEAGLYTAIMRANIPSAKEFKRWVTHEVLPSIRKHGGYLTDEKLEQALTDPDTIIRLATDLKNERARAAQLQAQAQLNAPKVLFADAVSTSKTNILVGELAKILRGNGIKIGQTRLFTWMRQNGYLISRKGSDWNTPTQKSMELELFRIKENTVVHSDGHTSITKTPKVTGKGQEYFISRFLDGTFSI